MTPITALPFVEDRFLQPWQIIRVGGILHVGRGMTSAWFLARQFPTLAAYWPKSLALIHPSALDLKSLERARPVRKTRFC